MAPIAESNSEAHYAAIGMPCKSFASLHPPFGTSFLSGAAHEAAAGNALSGPSDTSALRYY